MSEMPTDEPEWCASERRRSEDAFDLLAELADRPGVQRGVRFFGTLIGIQIIIGIIGFVVALVFIIIVASKVLGSS